MGYINGGKGKENYENYKNVPIIKVGVIGNENKGKTTILKKISDLELPTGFSIKTEGLSIKYPELKEHKDLRIVLLDSAGLETPVLNFNLPNQNSDNQEGDFLEKARDKLLTEVFLQNYIIKNSDLLLLVFGKLTFEEQKLLEKVKRDMQNVKRKESLMVIHNLKEFERKTQVEEYINETLLKSSTFKLEKNIIINKENNETYCNFYYYEPNSTPKIFHLIFAREGTEAGDYYNNQTIKYILDKTNDITDKQSFDIINSIQENFSSFSKNILEESIKKDEDLIIEDSKKIKLKNIEKKIKLKKCLIDEIGFSHFLSNLFEPKYNYYILDDSDNKNSDNSNKENKKLIINVEMPGDYKDKTIEKTEEGSYTFINIRGNKINNNDKINLEKNDRNDNSFSNRVYGEFNINIKLDKIKLESDNPDVKNEKGVTSFTYKIKPKENPISF